MFNVSALLLDDALLKFVGTEVLFFSCCFEDTDISQGSVATHFRCGGIFIDSIITNFLLILIVKRVWKLITVLIVLVCYAVLYILSCLPSWWNKRIYYSMTKLWRTKIVPHSWATLHTCMLLHCRDMYVIFIEFNIISTVCIIDYT